MHKICKFIKQSIFILLNFVLLLQPVSAATIQEMQDQINNKQQQKLEAEQLSHGLGVVASGIAGEIQLLTNQIASIQAQIDINTTKQEDLTKQIDVAVKRLGEQKDLLSANIRSMYIEGDISPLEMIASSKNLGDFVDKQEYRDRIKDNISSTMDEIERLKKQLDEQRREVTKILDDQKTLRGTLDQKNTEASAKLASVSQDKATFDAQVKERSGEIIKLQQDIAAAQAALSRVDISNLPSSGTVAQGSIIGTVGNTGNSFGAHLHLRAQIDRVAKDPYNYLGNRWIMPVNGPVTQGFGVNPYKYGYGAAGHDGIDFGVSAGTSIKAVEGGTLYKGWSQQLVGHWYFGCMAMIDHGGLLSIYAHMQEANCN
jgi:septal ring factor EnvC (AmiA/AmiB activator)